MATTRAGAPSMIARVSRLCVSTSRLRRQSTAHCRTPTDHLADQPIEVRPSGIAGGVAAGGAGRATSGSARNRANRSAAMPASLGSATSS